MELVVGTLRGTLDGDAANRQPAEERLGQLEQEAGYFAMLLQIITIKEIEVPIRQAAILRLKNIVKSYWTIREGKLNRISEQDRQVIKENIMEAVIWQEVSQVRVQLLEVMYYVAKGDFPDQWPALLPSIMKNFESQEPSRIHGAVSALLVVYKKFQFKPDAERGELVAHTFPVLQQLLGAVMSQSTLRAFDLMRCITKIFFMGCQLSVPAYLQNKEILSQWMTMLVQVFHIPVPAGVCSDEEMADFPLWKAKKWCGHIFHRIFNRFGRPKMADKGMKGFAAMIFTDFAPVLLQANMQMLEAKKNGTQVVPRVLQMCYNFLDSAVSYSALYKIIKPSRHFVLLESIFPTLCLTDVDLKLWAEDPQEFVRKSLDVMEEFHDPRVAATNLLITMVKVRTKDCLDMVLAAVMQIVNMYEQVPPDQKNLIHKEAALRMIGSLRSLLMANPAYRDPIESLLVKHVFPEFQNPVGFLRSRAAWTVGQFSKLKFADKSNQAQSITLVINALQDKELPVKLEASMAISRIVQDETVVEHIKPMVPMLLEQYFHIVDEVGSEEVVLTLGRLIEHIGADIAPYATQICERLVGLFLNLIKADEEDDESALTAVQCIRAVNTILYSLESLPELYIQMEAICQPLLVEMMKETAMEFMDDTLEMVTCFTYYPKEISPFMWSVLVMMVEAYHKFAVDYIRDMIPPLDNYISRGTDIFCGSQSPNYLQLVLSMITKVYDNEELKTEAKFTNKIMETILAHCRGKIDHIIPSMVGIVGKKLMVEKDLQFKLLICDVLGGAAYYNPILFVNVVKQLGPEFEKGIFNHWLSHLPEMKGAAKHQKMSVLGLASLCLVPRDQMSALLQPAFPEVLVQLVTVLTQLHEDGDEGDADDDDDDDEDDEEEILDIGDDEDNEDDLIGMEEYTKAMQDNLANILEGNVDAENYSSPLDDVDPFLFFAQCLENVAGTDAGFYQQWTGGLPAELQGNLQGVMTQAQERKQAKEQKAQEEASKR